MKHPKCEGCTFENHPNYTGFVPGVGATKPIAMFIGEAPGKEEIKMKIPFCGPTGVILRRMITQAKFDIDDLYITNTVKCRPHEPTNWMKDMAPSKEAKAECWERHLKHELEFMDPKVVVPVGAVAYDQITGAKENILDDRGYKFMQGERAVFPIIHPSFIMRGNNRFLAVTTHDLLKIRQYITEPLVKEKFELSLFPSVAEVEATCDMLIRENKPFTFDLETTGSRHKINILMVGLAYSDSQGICIPFLSKGAKQYWSDNDEMRVFGALAKLFVSGCEKIGQNVFTFDIPIMEEVGLMVASPVHDTLIMHHVLDPEMPHSLNFLGSIYTDLPRHKMKFKSMIAADDEVLRHYNVMDCIVTWRVAVKLGELMRRNL